MTMRGNARLRSVLGLLFLGGLVTASVLVWAQAPATGQVVAVRAGRLFDPKSGANLANQVVLIRGDKITDVGPAASVKIPAGARVIDLSGATVLPGLIDGHVHLTDAVGTIEEATRSATESLKAGFTTLVAQGSHGGKHTDVKLRNELAACKTPGPRNHHRGAGPRVRRPSRERPRRLPCRDARAASTWRRARQDHDHRRALLDAEPCD